MFRLNAHRWSIVYIKTEQIKFGILLGDHIQV